MCGDDAAFIQAGDARFLADEYFDAFGMAGDVEQMHQAAALFEQVEQFTQALHVGGEFFHIEQVLFAGDDVRCSVFVQCRAAGFQRQGHQRADVVAQALDFAGQPLLDLLEFQAGKVLVEVVASADQLRLGVGAVDFKDAILYIAIGGDDDQ